MARTRTPLRHHAAERLAAAVERAEQVDFDDPAPRRRIALPAVRARAVDAGIVDQHVQPAPGRTDVIEHLRHLVWVADIGVERERVTALVPNLPGDSLRCFGVDDVVHGNLRPGIGQGQGDHLADAGIGAGDQRPNAGELDLHLGSPHKQFCNARHRSPGSPRLRRQRN